MTDAITSEIVYPQVILSDVLDAVSKVKDIATKIVKDCQDSLEQINQEKLDIGLPQLDNEFTSLFDPADRPKNLSDLQKQKIIELGPHQPKLKSYPTNQEISSGKQCRFVFGWFKEYPHLEYSTKNDTVSCFVCSLFPTGPGREKAADAWINGLRSWDRMKSLGKDKQGKMAKHFSSEAHKAALSDLAQYTDGMRHVDVLLNKRLLAARVQEEEDNIRNEEIIKILLDIARTLARQQIAFRGSQSDNNGNFIQIAYLIARHNQHLRYWLSDERQKPYCVKYLSSESQNEFINILAEDVKSRIVSDVNASGMHSVMADTSPDTANTDRLVVAVRYIDEDNHPRERVLEMKETTDKTGEGQAKDILKSLNSKYLKKEDLVYQSYDYTASMSGVYRGAQQCLQDLVGRSIPYSCQGHRSNTFNEHTSNVQLVASMYTLLQELFVFFSQSCKRNIVLRDHLKTVENALKLRNLSKTRWVYRSQSIDAVWMSFEAVKDALKSVSLLENVDAATKTKACTLHDNMLKFDFIFTLMFMRPIMKKTKILTMEMQKEALNILDALILVEGTIISLKAIRESESEMDEQIEASIQFSKRFGTDPEKEFNRHHRPRRMTRRQDDNPDSAVTIAFHTYYRKVIIEVIDSLITEYNDNVKQCLEKIKPLAEVLRPPLQKPEIQQMNKISELFPPSAALNPECLHAEFEIFQQRVDKLDNSCNTVEDVFQQAYADKEIFPNVYKTCKLLFTAPVSVAKDERTFSKMKIVKNFLRSTMSDQRLDDLIVLATERDLVDSIDMNEALRRWASHKNRKLKIMLS
ncbi:52 kDa repressor of the inhibitor of the protein kinase-like [Dendronephthya gigantea]|uniref:52 kDa repressor of the inhibitor of the protein kinase-like n=1 Tax=Dendronephthya gigantea TaxID=151771 RepID=UPI00106B463B|nr:52 kDa repressor of the inhibitor of the protein kinase-like [Dendronephthya gigantea]